MAMLHDVQVESVEITTDTTGLSSAAQVKFALSAKTADGTVVRTVASFTGAGFPTNETEFVDNLWQGAFAEAFSPLGHTIPDEPEWSPFPIV